MKSTVRGALLMVAVAVALVVAPRLAAAQEERIDKRGVYLGFAGMGNFVVNQASAPVNGFISHGGGFSVFLGVRVGYMVALEAAYALNIHNPVQNSSGVTVDALLLHAGTLDLKILFPNGSSVRPFIQAGLGVYELASYADRTDYRNGVGFQLGGGLDIWLTRHLSIGGRVLYHGIYFTQDIDGDRPFLSTLSIEGNLQVHF